MKALHLICGKAKHGIGKEGVTKVAGEKDIWTSGTWVTDGYEPDEIVGGRLYLHTTKAKPSDFGGEVLSYEYDGDRVVFKLRSLMDCKGVGWRGRKDAMAHCGYIVEIAPL